MINQLEVKKLPALFRKAVAINSKPTEETFPELPTILIWMRFVLGAAFGTYVGLKGVKSGAIALQALNMVAFLPFVYCRMYLGTEGDAFGTSIIFAGTVQAVALALLLWIYFYTAQMEEQELNFIDVLIPPADETVDGGVGGGDPADAVVEETLSVPIQEQDEF